MANNPYRNKVELADGTVLMDLTGDTVEAGKMLSGYTAHDASGAPVTGTIPTKSASDLSASGDTVSVPAFGHLIFTNQRNLLLGDYLIDAIPCKDFMGTQLHFGDDTFKTWEEIIEFFSRLGGQ